MCTMINDNSTAVIISTYYSVVMYFLITSCFFVRRLSLAFNVKQPLCQYLKSCFPRVRL